MHCHGEAHGPNGWRGFAFMARRGAGGFGGPGGGWGHFGGRGDFGGPGGFGENMRIGRMLASGDLRLLALYLIEQQPRHGYDLIKAIEEKTAGFYSPSPGIVYPALTFLEEAGFATSSTEGNKKLYTITNEGRVHLDENRATVAKTFDFLGKVGERMTQWRDRSGGDDGHGSEGEARGRFGRRDRSGGDRDIPGVSEEVNAARRELKAAISDALDSGDADAQQRLADILRKAAELIRRRDVDLG